MIPIISTQLTIEQQTSKVGYKLSTLFPALTELNDIFFGSCNSKKDISHQIPLWVVFEKESLESQGLNSITIFDFLQKYYDWLYCDTESGSGYQIGQKLLDLIDIEKTREEYVKRLASIYANGIEDSAYSDTGGKLDIQNVRNFVKNIRKNFYHKKSTVDGIRYFFRTLYNIPEENVKIEYPKKFLLRLNGGKFYNENFVFTGSTGSYEDTNALNSYLNYSRLQDGNFYQDYSYLLKVGIQSSYYKDTYKTLAHPAGLKVLFEKTLEDYVGPTDDYDSQLTCQQTFLKNYAAYKFINDYSGNILGSSGSVTYYGLDECAGCTFGIFSAPSYAFPNWHTTEALGNDFQNIQIKNIFSLCYDVITVSNPNAGLTCSSC